MKITKRYRKEVALGILDQFQYDVKRWMKGGFGRTAASGHFLGGITACETRQAVCMCLAGAAIQAGTRIEDIGKVAKALGFEDECEMYKWNDNPERTFGEVIDRVVKALV